MLSGRGSLPSAPGSSPGLLADTCAVRAAVMGQLQEAWLTAGPAVHPSRLSLGGGRDAQGLGRGGSGAADPAVRPLGLCPGEVGCGGPRFRLWLWWPRLPQGLC